MLSQRRGLSVRVQPAVSKCDAFEKESLKPHIEQKVALRQENKENPIAYTNKTSHSSSLAIFKDVSSSACQHCGIDKSAIVKSVRKVHVSIQTSNDTSDGVKDILCSENPSPEYYKELAEQRREALIETLAENKELCDIVEALQAEVSRLSKYEEMARNFMYNIQEADGVEPEML